MVKCYMAKTVFKMVFELTKKQCKISLEKFLFLFSSLVFFPPFMFWRNKWVKGLDLVASHPNTFHNIFDSGSSGSFKARTLTIPLRTLNYDDLNIRKRRLWKDQRSHPEASLLSSFHFHFFKTTRMMLDPPSKGSPII